MGLYKKAWLINYAFLNHVYDSILEFIILSKDYYYSLSIIPNTNAEDCFAANGKNSSKDILASPSPASEIARTTTKGTLKA